MNVTGGVSVHPLSDPSHTTAAMGIPSGGVIAMIVITCMISGITSGMTGFGAAILIQTCFRVAVFLFKVDLGTPEELSSLILSLVSITVIALNIAGGITALRTRPRKFRADLVGYLAPGTNGMMFLGNYVAVTLKQDFLTRFLGLVLILASVWQFSSINILTFLRRLRSGELTKDEGSSQPAQTNDASAADHRELAKDTDKLTGAGFVSSSSHKAIPSDHGPQGEGVAYPISSTDSTVELPDEGSASSHDRRVVAGAMSHQPLEDIELDVLDQPKHSPVSASSSTSHSSTTPLAVESASPSENTEEDKVIEIRANGCCRRFVALCKRVIQHIKANRRDAILGFTIGALSGFLGGAFGIAGPPVMIYFTMLGIEGAAIRDTYLVTCFVSNPFTIATRIAFGVFRLSNWFIYLLSTVVVVVGLRIGYYLHHRINTESILVILQVLIVCASIPLMEPHVYAGGFGPFACVVYAVVLLYFGIVLIWKHRKLSEFRKHQATSVAGPQPNAEPYNDTDPAQQSDKL